MRRFLAVLLIFYLSVALLAIAVAKRITSKDELIGGPEAAGRVGDYLIKNEFVTFIIGDKDNYHGYMRSGGNVLDAALTGTNYDLLDEFHTYFGWPKQLIAEKIEIVNNGSNGKAAVIKVTGHHSHIKGIKITSWYILDPGVNYLKIVTTLENNSGKDFENFILGDAAFFGYTRAFLWGKGFNVNKADTLLLGAQGDGLAYGFTTTEYDPNTADMRRIHIAYIFADPEVKRVNFKNGEKVTYERLFFVARDLATIQREILDMRGMSYTLLKGYVVDVEGNTLSNTRVEVIDESGKVYSVAYTNAVGMYEVPLLEGSYKIVVNVEGMKTVKPFRVVASGSGVVIAKPVIASFVERNTIVWGPYINKVGEDFVEISWRSSVESSGKVIVKNFGEFEDEKIAKLHHVLIKDLKPGKTYEYKVVLGSEKTKGLETEWYTFKTFARDPDTITFVVYGDTRTYDKRHRFVADKILEKNPDFVLIAGDLVMDGRIKSDWDGFFWAIKNLASRIPYFTAHGNHEYNATFYYDAFDIPKNKAWYSFDIGNAHFVVLNADVLLMQRDEKLMEKETKWLEEDLSKTDKKFKFVFFHEPFWTNCVEYGEEGTSPTISYWKPIFEKYKVDVVFNSHYHLYERFFENGIHYITTGGGGAPLYLKLRKNRLPNTVKIVTGKHHFVLVKVRKDSVDVKVIAVAEQIDKKREDAFRPIPEQVIDEFTVRK